MLSQYHHTAWTVRDGAPAEVQALAQTPDGYLWVATATGLFRFDGLTFERWDSRETPLRNSDISSLAVGPRGELWIGYRFGGVSVMRGGRLQTFTDSAGMPSGTMFDFAFVGDTVWIAGAGGVGWFDGEKWRRVRSTDSVKTEFSTLITFDSRGRLWFSSSDGLYMRERRRKRFRRVAQSLGGNIHGSLREAKDGVMWASSSRTGLAQLTITGDSVASTPATVAPWRTGPLLFDRRDALWISTGDGVVRLTSTRPVSTFEQIPIEEQRLGVAQGLSGDAIVAILEDREGNIWTATAGGIDRFRPNRLRRIQLPLTTFFLSVVPIDKGRVLIASSNKPVLKAQDFAVEVLGAPSVIEATSRDHEGTVWLAGQRSLWRSNGDRFDPVALPLEIGASYIQSVARDRSGTLWIGVVRSGVWRLRDSVWSLDRRVTRAGDAATVITPDRKRRVWFGSSGNRITVLERGRYRDFTAANGLDLGTVFVIEPRGERTWIGGERGVSVIRDDRVFTPNGWDQFRGTSGIIENSNGDLWLNAAIGVVRISAVHVERSLADSTFRAPYDVFDFRDGREGIAPQLRPIPSAAQGTDGRLWFTTGTQVAWIDTVGSPKNPLPPPVYIRSFTADSTFTPRDSIHLAKGTRNVQVSYTALSLSIPERIRFRYRLEGSDSVWQDAGDRRAAYFTNLGPGTYRFQVIASNNDGVWNTTGASQVFTIAPRFVETRWFYALVAISGLLVIWLLNAIRLRQVARGLRARYDAKLEERTRIAQELHDTLLQGFTGITLQLEGVQRSLPARPDVAVETLSRVLGLADRTLRDARHMVWDMRAPELDTMDLATAVGAAVRAAGEQTDVVLNYVVRGDQRRLPLARETAVLRIAREAVTNAVRHAKAQLISVELTYEKRQIQLRISDNGRGLVHDEVVAASKEGHWGMEGMRGRAERLNGTLRIDSAEGRGTDVTLTLPTGD